MKMLKTYLFYVFGLLELPVESIRFLFLSHKIWYVQNLKIVLIREI